MNRSGFDEQDIPQLLEFFEAERSVYIRSIFSHLAGSDEAKHDDFTLEQIHLFERMTECIQSRFNYKIWRHILNSAGIERFPQTISTWFVSVSDYTGSVLQTPNFKP